MKTKLFVGNLNYDTKDEELRKLFEPYGTVESVTVVIDKKSGRSKGYGFVQMAETKDAARALEISGREFMGRDIIVTEADSPGTVTAREAAGTASRIDGITGIPGGVMKVLRRTAGKTGEPGLRAGPGGKSSSGPFFRAVRRKPRVRREALRTRSRNAKDTAASGAGTGGDAAAAEIFRRAGLPGKAAIRLLRADHKKKPMIN